MKPLTVLGLLVATSAAAHPHGGYEADPPVREAARDGALLTYPLELVLGGALGAPRLELEWRFDLGGTFALGLRPMAEWYPPDDGWGVGGGLVFAWYLEQAMSGPYIALLAGDLEAFTSEGRGRMTGASAIFGFGFSWETGLLVNLGLGIGYWHRSGALDPGLQIAEVLSLRLGVGWGYGD